MSVMACPLAVDPLTPLMVTLQQGLGAERARVKPQQNSSPSGIGRRSVIEKKKAFKVEPLTLVCTCFPAAGFGRHAAAVLLTALPPPAVPPARSAETQVVSQLRSICTPATLPAPPLREMHTSADCPGLPLAEPTWIVVANSGSANPSRRTAVAATRNSRRNTAGCATKSAEGIGDRFLDRDILIISGCSLQIALPTGL